MPSASRIALAADLRGEAHVLLVVRPPAHAETPEERARAARGRAQQNLSRGSGRLPGPEPAALGTSTEVVYADDPAQAIAAYAEEHGFDLVVVGGHGREQMIHRGIGQLARGAAASSPLPGPGGLKCHRVRSAGRLPLSSDRAIGGSCHVDRH